MLSSSIVAGRVLVPHRTLWCIAKFVTTIPYNSEACLSMKKRANRCLVHMPSWNACHARPPSYSTNLQSAAHRFYNGGCNPTSPCSTNVAAPCSFFQDMLYSLTDLRVIFVTLHDELTDKLTFGIVNGVDEKASQRKEGKATKHVIKQAEVASSASMCE